MPRNHFRKIDCAPSGTLGKNDYDNSSHSFIAGTMSDSLYQQCLSQGLTQHEMVRYLLHQIQFVFILILKYKLHIFQSNFPNQYCLLNSIQNISSPSELHFATETAKYWIRDGQPIINHGPLINNQNICHILHVSIHQTSY